MKKRLIAVLMIVTVVVALALLAYHPFLDCNINVPENYIEAIKGQSKGLYSNTVPLVPVYVSVDGYDGTAVYYTIHYFPFGTVGMSYIENEGYNIEKSLAGF